MNSGIPIVHIFGVEGISLETSKFISPFESRMECICHKDDSNILSDFAVKPPSAIVSVGDDVSFKNLSNSPYSIRSIWLHYPDTSNLSRIADDVFRCFIYRSTIPHGEEHPVVSVFTSAYNSGMKIFDVPYQSLLRQTYLDWEWVIYDDSTDHRTSMLIDSMASGDYRIKVVRTRSNTGNIGFNKRMACKASSGKYLVELDHDDELTPNALMDIVEVFEKHPEAGFVYTDFAECHEDMSPVYYGKDPFGEPPNTDWGFGYGSYRTEEYNGHTMYVANSPNINAKTIRHIIAAPNHARCWRASTYFDIGGHSEKLYVADDYELMVRTFLKTIMVRLPKMCYVQYRNKVGNTHRSRNGEIQRIVTTISAMQDESIHRRFEELGVDDWVYQKGIPWIFSNKDFKNPKYEPYANKIYGLT